MVLTMTEIKYLWDRSHWNQVWFVTTRDCWYGWQWYALPGINSEGKKIQSVNERWVSPLFCHRSRSVCELWLPLSTEKFLILHAKDASLKRLFKIIYMARQLKYLYTVYPSRLSQWHVSSRKFHCACKASTWATVAKLKANTAGTKWASKERREEKKFRSGLPRKTLLFTYFSNEWWNSRSSVGDCIAHIQSKIHLSSVLGQLDCCVMQCFISFLHYSYFFVLASFTSFPPYARNLDKHFSSTFRIL